MSRIRSFAHSLYWYIVAMSSRMARVPQSWSAMCRIICDGVSMGPGEYISATGKGNGFGLQRGWLWRCGAYPYLHPIAYAYHSRGMAQNCRATCRLVTAPETTR